MAPKLLSRGEISLLLVTIALQVVSLFTLLRVATGVASTGPPSGTNSSRILSIPSSVNQNVSVPSSTPQFNSPAGSSIDASLILALGFVAANIVVIGFLAYLYRKRKMKLFSLVVSIFLIFNVTELYFSFILGLYSIIPPVAAIAGSIITLGAAFLGKARVTNGLALLLALELGSTFPVLLQAPLNWIIPLVYAIFDVYAVYFGHLGKLVREVSTGTPEGEKPLRSDLNVEPVQKKGKLANWKEFGLLSVSLGDIEIGMADLAFYAMVPVVALVLKNLLAFFVVMAAVDLGLVLSFLVFKKSEVSPGLPIPILSGLGGLLILFLI